MMNKNQFPSLTASFFSAIALAFVILTLNSCTQSNLTVASEVGFSSRNNKDDDDTKIREKILWSDKFTATKWKELWHIKSEGSWGLENLKIIKDPSNKFERVLRIHYPAGSASPSVSRKYKAPLGGAQFYATLGIISQKSLRLSYYLRFSENFDFVKGGKLPGLFGGTGSSGGRIPNGTDGFSTRFMWRKEGDGEVYAYLPSSDDYGTSIGRGNWRFKAGVWYRIEQEIVLNEPGEDDGRIRVWIDGKQVIDEDDLVFRAVDTLKIDGIFFSTFFGGNDPSWVTPKDVYIDFADFSIREAG